VLICFDNKLSVSISVGLKLSQSKFSHFKSSAFIDLVVNSSVFKLVIFASLDINLSALCYFT